MLLRLVEEEFMCKAGRNSDKGRIVFSRRLIGSDVHVRINLLKKGSK